MASALCRSRSTTLPSRTTSNDFLARGGDGYVTFRDASEVLPIGDSPLIANEIIDYVKDLGTVRTAIEGRIIVK